MIMSSESSEHTNKKNDEVTKEFAFQEIKEKMENIKEETSARINEELQKMVNEIVNNIEKEKLIVGKLHHLFSNNIDQTVDKIKTKSGHLPDKLFMTRNSLLTDLLEIKHIRSIYHVFLAILFGLFVNTAMHDLLYKGEIESGFHLIAKGFANIHTLILVWLCMFCSTLATYVGVEAWHSVRSQILHKKLLLKLWDKLWCALYIIYFIGYLYTFTSLVRKWNLTEAESMGALSEMVRLFMKTHAYVRSTVPKLLKSKPDTPNGTSYLNFSKFLYFLFAPTLVYRDSYPRTKEIRWKFVILCFAEFMGCILYICYILERFLISAFEDVGRKHYKWQDVLLIILGNSMAGILILLCTFYGLLHAWQNGFAEMLRFGDRAFYKDWWTSTTFERFYRTWNVIVHDWLYTYVYKDMYEIVAPKNKLLAKFMVFFLSAVFHEFILGFSFKFCYPTLFILFFGFGLAVSFLKIENGFIGNSGIWYGLAIGTSIPISTLCMEFYARRNCPVEDVTIASYFIPQSIMCNNT